MAALAAGTARSSRRKPTETHTAAFERYIGIDYFGAQTPTANLTRLRVYLADRTALPGEVLPPPGPREHWRRQCEERAKAKSVFHFDVQGAVAKSSHAGIPWLRYPYRQLDERAHFWPFDGGVVPPGKSAITEVYPALWKQMYPTDGRTPDQHDAYVIAGWLRQADRDGRLACFLHPTLTPPERTIAEVGGWIPGVL